MGCGILYDEHGNPIGHICGSGVIPCCICGRPSDYLCDYPIGNGKTCDLPLCDHHANTMGDNVDFCPIHHSKYWEKERIDFDQKVIKITRS